MHSTTVTVDDALREKIAREYSVPVCWLTSEDVDYGGHRSGMLCKKLHRR